MQYVIKVNNNRSPFYNQYATGIVGKLFSPNVDDAKLWRNEQSVACGSYYLECMKKRKVIGLTKRKNEYISN